MNTIVFSSWYLKLDITVTKIKAFFSLGPAKMTKVIELGESKEELVDAAARSQSCDGNHNGGLSLLYIELEVDDVL